MPSERQNVHVCIPKSSGDLFLVFRGSSSKQDRDDCCHCIATSVRRLQEWQATATSKTIEVAEEQVRVTRQNVPLCAFSGFGSLQPKRGRSRQKGRDIAKNVFVPFCPLLSPFVPICPFCPPRDKRDKRGQKGQMGTKRDKRDKRGQKGTK